MHIFEGTPRTTAFGSLKVLDGKGTRALQYAIVRDRSQLAQLKTFPMAYPCQSLFQSSIQWQLGLPE